MQDLIKAAMAARKKSHAPYSKFYVGAAMRDEQSAFTAGPIWKMRPIRKAGARNVRPFHIWYGGRNTN